MELPIHLNVAAIAVQSQELELNIEVASKQYNNKSWGLRDLPSKLVLAFLTCLVQTVRANPPLAEYQT